MLKRVVITNYLGEQMEYKIEGVQDNDKSGLLITGIDGLGPVKADINMTDLTTSDGGLFNSARLEKRNIVISAYFTNSGTIEQARLLSYKYFPIKRPLYFYIETDEREAFTYGYVESNEPDIFQQFSGCKISVLCESPYFTSAAGSDVMSFSDVTPAFRFVYKNTFGTKETIFGTIEHKVRENLEYTGDCDTGVVITMNVTGDVKKVHIYDLSTSDVLYLDTDKLDDLLPEETGVTHDKFIYGDTIIINTQQKQKSIYLVRGGVTYSILNILGKNPGWITFSKGINQIMYAADEGAEYLKIVIEAPVLYEGV